MEPFHKCFLLLCKVYKQFCQCLSLNSIRTDGLPLLSHCTCTLNGISTDTDSTLSLIDVNMNTLNSSYPTNISDSHLEMKEYLVKTNGQPPTHSFHFSFPSSPLFPPLLSSMLSIQYMCYPYSIISPLLFYNSLLINTLWSPFHWFCFLENISLSLSSLHL